VDDAMVNTLSLAPGNPEPMHETPRDVMCSLRILDFSTKSFLLFQSDRNFFLNLENGNIVLPSRRFATF